MKQTYSWRKCRCPSQDFWGRKAQCLPSSCACSGGVSLPAGLAGLWVLFRSLWIFLPALQVGDLKSVWAEPLGALPPLQTERRWNVDSRQSCDILRSIVILMWSMHSLYCVPHALSFPLHPPHFFFLPQDRIISHISKTSKMAFQLLVFIDSLNFRKDQSGPFSLIMKTRGQ